MGFFLSLSVSKEWTYTEFIFFTTPEKIIPGSGMTEKIYKKKKKKMLHDYMKLSIDFCAGSSYVEWLQCLVVNSSSVLNCRGDY